MPDPKTLGRVDWMPRKKVWRVIWYKGAADIPVGDYSTRKEAEESLRELVARGNPGDIKVTPEVTRDYWNTNLEHNALRTSNKTDAGAFLSNQIEAGGDILREYAKGEYKDWNYIYEKVRRLQRDFGSRDWTDPLDITEIRYLEKIKTDVANLPVVDEVTKQVKEILSMAVVRNARGVKASTDTLDTMFKEMRAKPVIPKAEASNPGFTAKEAKNIGEKLGIDFKSYDVEQFRRGLNVELEHCNVTNCDPILTGKIAQAHLNELPDYYTRLAKMEKVNSMKTETERKSFHERIFGKGSTPPLERLGKGETLNSLLPMEPTDGPPLPRVLGIRWFWKK